MTSPTWRLLESILRDMGQAKNKVRTQNFRKANFNLFKELVNRKLLSGIREQNRDSISLRRCFIEKSSSKSPDVRNKERKARDLHDRVKTCWSN